MKNLKANFPWHDWMRHVRLLVVWSVLQVFAANVFAEGNTPNLDEARKLLKEGRAEQAAVLLEQDILKYSGNPDYDYLLGLALYQSGQSGQALFAFERVMMADPSNADARLKAARINVERAGGAVSGSNRATPVWGSLLDAVAKRPSFIPAQVVAKLDSSAAPVRQVSIDKAGLPEGSSIDTASAIITTPLNVEVTDIAGITLNTAAFTNSGQFDLVDNSLIIYSSKISQPAIGVTDTYVLTLNNVSGGTTLVTVDVSHGSVKINSITVMNGAPAAAPTASDVTITGAAQVGRLLTGNYIYAQENDNAQGASTFRWLRNGFPIMGATARTYWLAHVDQGSNISFEVTPVTVGKQSGMPALSPPTVAVAGVGAPIMPSALGVMVSGITQVGQVLTGNYVYFDANHDPEGASTFLWLRDGIAIPGATARTYTLVAADQGHQILFEVKPLSLVAPTTGARALSYPTQPVAGVGAPAAPTATGVSISGTVQVGQLLSGHYTYVDANNDPEGPSTFRWLSNNTLVATTSTYLLQASDQGHSIRFEVTAVATVAPPSGAPVPSSPTAAVAGVGAPAAPDASAVSISGNVQVGELLSGHYTYADANNDPEGVSTFRWLSNGTVVSTSSTYLLNVSDQGNTIVFEVTPVSTVAPSTGTAVQSSPTVAVVGAGAAAAPTATNVSISGVAQVGQLLTGSYSYSDANSDPEGTSSFRWLRDGTAIPGATGASYTLDAADQGHSIRFEVTPVATVAPATGAPVVSNATTAVAGVGAPAAPTASAVSITGTALVPNVLTGHYSYADANNDPEGVSTFRWLRNGAPIPGATAITYALAPPDHLKNISFEVTPVSTASPTTGAPVGSVPPVAVP